MDGSESNYFNLACVVQLLVHSGLVAYADGWQAFRRLSHGRTWEWSGRKMAWSLSRKNLICGTCKYFLRLGEIPAAELGSHLLPNGENPISRVAKPVPWERKIPAAESRLRVGKIPQQNVMDTERRACVAASKRNSRSDMLVIGPAKKWPEMGMSASDKLDASIPGMGPYLVWRSGTSEWE